MSNVTSGQRVLIEEGRWDRIVAEILSPNAELVSVSRWIPDSRAYAESGRIAVIRMARHAAYGSLAGAAAAQVKLGIPGEYVRGDGWEALMMPRVEGVTLEGLIPHIGRRERLRLLLKVVVEIRRMHEHGVAHGDLRPDNVIVTPTGAVQLVDFDRAAVVGPLRAAMADWLGLGARGPSPKPYWKLLLLTLEPRTRSAFLRLRSVLSIDQGQPTPSDPTLRLLGHAWDLARTSSANAPGQDIAYYAFSFAGHHFPGERAWYERWEPIRHRVDFTGKRVIELGCNMGLLSSFAMLHGASYAIGVDHSTRIVEAARLVASALGTSAQFECVDLVSDLGWERRLSDGDIVTAMSLVHWLPSPDRVLRFLSGHAELIYEGHDTLAVETSRLRRLGFVEIEVLCRTARGREVLYARR
jgi:hypothetical protein